MTCQSSFFINQVLKSYNKRIKFPVSRYLIAVMATSFSHQQFALSHDANLKKVRRNNYLVHSISYFFNTFTLLVLLKFY